MEQVYNYFIKCGYIFELIIATVIFVYSLKMRKFFALRCLLCVALLIGVYSVYKNFVPRNVYTEITIYTVMFFLTAGAVCFCFNTTYWVALFCEIGAYATQHMAYKTGDYFRNFCGDYLITGIFVYLLFEALVIFLSYYFFARKIKKNEAKFIENRQVTLLCAALIVFTTACQNIYVIYAGSLQLPLVTIVLLYDVLCCLFTIAIQYGMFRSGKLTEENQLMDHIVSLQHDQYEASKQNIDLVNVKVHDLKHQLLRFRTKISDEEHEELEKTISIYDSALKTGSEILDVVLAEKSLLCEKQQIKLNCIADGECLSFLKTADVYSLFGNILDNAIEAVSTIGDVEKRIVTLTVKESMGMAHVRIENCFFSHLQFENDLPKTTKQDKEYHGFGLKSVKMIVEKYAGVLTLSTENDSFILSILFPLK